MMPVRLSFRLRATRATRLMQKVASQIPGRDTPRSQEQSYKKRTVSSHDSHSEKPEHHQLRWQLLLLLSQLKKRSHLVLQATPAAHQAAGRSLAQARLGGGIDRPF